MPTVVVIQSTFPTLDFERAILTPAGYEVVLGKPGPETALVSPMYAAKVQRCHGN